MALGNKEVMATNIKSLMSQKGVTASNVCADLNIAMATFSDWCHAKTYPRIDKIEQLAEYFGVKKSRLVEVWSDIDWDPKAQEIIINCDETELQFYIGKIRELSDRQKRAVYAVIDSYREE